MHLLSAFLLSLSALHMHSAQRPVVVELLFSIIIQINMYTVLLVHMYKQNNQHVYTQHVYNMYTHSAVLLAL